MKFCWASIFPISQIQDWELPNKKCPEKAGTIVRASSEFDGRRWFRLSAVMVLVQFSV